MRGVPVQCAHNGAPARELESDVDRVLDLSYNRQIILAGSPKRQPPPPRMANAVPVPPAWPPPGVGVREPWVGELDLDLDLSLQ